MVWSVPNVFYDALLMNQFVCKIFHIHTWNSFRQNERLDDVSVKVLVWMSVNNEDMCALWNILLSLDSIRNWFNKLWVPFRKVFVSKVVDNDSSGWCSMTTYITVIKYVRIMYLKMIRKEGHKHATNGTDLLPFLFYLILVLDFLFLRFWFLLHFFRF